ncbi:MAG: BlaI/MecI/CopY family transcriptional regulator [Opitutaceae bacterium]|jgi:predicted transcriptional regulator
MRENRGFKFTRAEMELLEVLWKLGSASIREIQERLPENRRLEYTTIQTVVYRLEEKGAVERVRKIGNAHIFRPLVSRQSVTKTLFDDFLAAFGASPEPFLAHLVESGKISLKELKELEKIARERRLK